ncbi:hypothetical protein UE46_11215 [Listeria weihenstephanensis]|uniref:Lipoprotein n=1 Tax=Listeria weihenstephanensis TaxID=1006155 RepID=A0A1S7FW17_9LIST|nr:hypothetical protein [Listeria weihenstephanensis]AQY51547.1 hypothetical protein UE46_11215 [Listeria weihenstephanensis]
MVKKIVCILFLILILTGCSNQSEASSERMSEKQETIKIELSTVLGKNGSIVEGNARNGNTIILGNDTEIGSFDFIEKKYTKYFDVSYGNEGDSVVDISASFQDDRYLVITQFQKRSINSQILWPKTYYVYDKGKNKLVETIENPIEISDDKKIGGYAPLSVFKDNQLVMELQEPTTGIISLYKFDCTTKTFVKLINNAGNPKLYDDILFYVTMGDKAVKSSTINYCEDWLTDCSNLQQLISNNNLIEEYQIVGDKQVVYIEVEKDGREYKMMLNDELVFGQVSNTGLISSSGNNLVLDYYTNDNIILFDYIQGEKSEIARGSFISNVSLDGDIVTWIQPKEGAEKGKEEYVLYIYTV